VLSRSPATCSRDGLRSSTATWERFVSRQTVSGQATASFLCVHRYMWLTLYGYVNCRIPAPFSSVYHASKAAAVMFSDHQRIKLAPFGIIVIDLKAGWVKSNFHRNRSDESRLPKRSIYEPMRWKRSVRFLRSTFWAGWIWTYGQSRC